MKKLLTVFLLLISTTAFAQHHHHHHRGGFHAGNWVAPVIIGGIIGYELNNRPRYIYENYPVVVQQQPVVVQQTQQVVCTEWKEIQQPDGKIYRERTCQSQ